jgi:chromosome segregation ATPase
MKEVLMKRTVMIGTILLTAFLVLSVLVAVLIRTNSSQQNQLAAVRKYGDRLEGRIHTVSLALSDQSNQLLNQSNQLSRQSAKLSRQSNTLSAQSNQLSAQSSAIYVHPEELQAVKDELQTAELCLKEVGGQVEGGMSVQYGYASPTVNLSQPCQDYLFGLPGPRD